MRDTDELAFGAIFLKLRKIFGLRGDQSEVQGVAQSYFRALMKYPLRAIESAADAWITQGEHFPKPAQLIRVMPRLQSETLPNMMDPEASEHRRAVLLGYEDEPCSCHDCKAAEVSHRMLRYVPDEDRDGNDRRMMLDGKVVTTGHWIHGVELKRWYDARDAFFSQRDKYAGKLPKVMKKPTKVQLQEEADRMGVELTNELPEIV